MQQKMRLQIANMIKAQSQDRGKEQEERKQVKEFIAQSEIQEIFAAYEKPLRALFKFYAA